MQNDVTTEKADRKAPLFVLDVRQPDPGRSDQTALFGDLFDGALLDDIGSLTAQLKGDELAQAIVLYDSAVTALCRALQQGADSAAALNDWGAQARHSLQPLLRRHRGRIALVETRALAANPDDMLRKAAQYLERESKATDVAIGGEAADPIHHLIAAEMLAATADLSALDRELEAQAIASDPAGDTNRAASAAKAYDAMAAAIESGQARQLELDREISVLQSENQKLAQERDQAARAVAKLEGWVELQQAQLGCLQDDLEVRQHTAARLHAVEREKEARDHAIGELRAELAALKHERALRDAALAEREAQLEALWSSTSWRVTAPMRRVKMALTGQSPEPRPARDAPERELPIDDQPVAGAHLDQAPEPNTGLPLHNRRPKISVVTVVFQDPEGLEKTIASVQSQRFRDYEYIVIDGASKDRTAEVLKTHQLAIDVLVSEPDRGIYDAMNKGIRAAQGEYILFMNAGDSFVDADTLEEVAGELNGEDVVYGHRYYMRKSGPVLQRSHEIEYAQHRMPYCHQAAYYKRETLEKHPFNLTYKYAADYNQVVELYLAGCRFKQIDKVLCNFFPGGASESGLRPYLDVLKIQFDNFGSGEVMRKSEYMQGFVKNIPELLSPYGYEEDTKEAGRL